MNPKKVRCGCCRDIDVPCRSLGWRCRCALVRRHRQISNRRSLTASGEDRWWWAERGGDSCLSNIAKPQPPACHRLLTAPQRHRLQLPLSKQLLRQRPLSCKMHIIVAWDLHHCGLVLYQQFVSSAGRHRASTAGTLIPYRALNFRSLRAGTLSSRSLYFCVLFGPL